MDKRQKNRVCFIGIMLIITGSTSFSNYPWVSKAFVIAGMILIIAKEVMWRRRKA